MVLKQSQNTYKFIDIKYQFFIYFLHKSYIYLLGILHSLTQTKFSTVVKGNALLNSYRSKLSGNPVMAVQCYFYWMSLLYWNEGGCTLQCHAMRGGGHKKKLNNKHIVTSYYLDAHNCPNLYVKYGNNSNFIYNLALFIQLLVIHVTVFILNLKAL